MAEPRAVVMGYGNAGRTFHAYLIGITPGLSLHGVISSREEARERAAQEHGCATYERLKDALAHDAVDLVVIATPNHTHAALAEQALEAGKHVVVDKPVCLSLAEFDRVADAARRSGKLFLGFQNRRYDGDWLTVRQLEREGRFGDLARAELAWTNFAGWGGWRGERASGGGKLYDLGPHLADQLALLFPQRIERVYAQIQYGPPEREVERDARVMVAFEGGATGILETSSINALWKPRFYVTGTGGTFEKHGLDPQEAAMKQGDIDAAEEPDELYGRFSADGKTVETIPTVLGRWRTYYEQVRDAIQGEAEPPVKPAEMRRAIGILDAAFASSARGEAIAVNLPPAS